MNYRHELLREALTFDDVSIVPGPSDVLPGDVTLETKIAPAITLKAPLLSAAMDTVTGAPMATAMALAGGLGIIHKNQPADQQAKAVKEVKVTKLKATQRNTAAVDGAGQLLVGAAVGVGKERRAQVKALVQAGVDVVCIDTAHGHSFGVLDAVRQTRREFPQLMIIAGNVVTAEAVTALALAGVDCCKVGVGPGSICTTRVVAGVGVPQITAIIDCARAAQVCGIRIIADGGIRYSGDIVKAVAAGADAVMVGSLLAGTDESPGELIMVNSQQRKTYRGMGSLGAMTKGSKDRYFQGEVNETKKLVPEGVEGSVPYRGKAADVIYQLLGGLRAGMGYTGSATVAELGQKAEFVRVTNAGHRESHPHDITIIKESPNY